MKHNIHVHAYRVESTPKKKSMETLLSEIKSDALEERVRSVNGVNFRVESIEKKNDRWHMDFIKFRSAHGPGAASASTEIRGFEFGEGEVFGEETAVIYCPQTNAALIQYNHNGARVGTIETYLNNYSDISGVLCRECRHSRWLVCYRSSVVSRNLCSPLCTWQVASN